PNGAVSNTDGDTTPPTVSIAAPTAGTAVSGTVTVLASASDNVGVSGVQFKLDGVNIGSEVTAAPYAISWNTTLYSDGTHTLTAVGRDAAGNQAASAAVSITVSNISSSPPPPPPSGGSVLLVDFGSTSSGNTFGLPGWSTVIKDEYTDYRDIGPGGTTIVI